MLAVTEYRALLDRFFVLARMEKLATIKLRMSTEMGGKEELLDSLHEELLEPISKLASADETRYIAVVVNPGSCSVFFCLSARRRHRSGL